MEELSNWIWDNTKPYKDFSWNTEEKWWHSKFFMNTDKLKITRVTKYWFIFQFIPNLLWIFKTGAMRMYEDLSSKTLRSTHYTDFMRIHVCQQDNGSFPLVKRFSFKLWVNWISLTYPCLQYVFVFKYNRSFEILEILKSIWMK